MAVTSTPHVPAPPGARRETPPHQVGSAGARRAAVVASRSAAAGPPPAAAVYAPWKTLQAQADSRLKAEITDALHKLDTATTEAAQLLDRAHALAAEAGGHLEAAAWDTWVKYMTLADHTRNGILGKATTEYDHAITRARDAYAKALTTAEDTHKAALDDVGRAQADARTAAA